MRNTVLYHAKLERVNFLLLDLCDFESLFTVEMFPTLR